MSGGGKSSSVTVGYRYHLGMHMALCHGPLDSVTQIEVDGRIAWQGFSDGGSITVAAEDLFGGDKREGGVSGVVDLEFGEPSQGLNDYLSQVLPGVNTAYRGVACAVLRQCYMGNNPYLKPWAFQAIRTQTLTNGLAQWNPEQASLKRYLFTLESDECFGYDCDAFSSTLLQVPGILTYGIHANNNPSGPAGTDETGNGLTWSLVDAVGTVTEFLPFDDATPASCDLNYRRVNQSIAHPFRIIPAADTPYNGSGLTLGAIVRRYRVHSADLDNAPILSIHRFRTPTNRVNLNWDTSTGAVTISDQYGTQPTGIVMPPLNTWFMVQMYMNMPAPCIGSGANSPAAVAVSVTYISAGQIVTQCFNGIATVRCDIIPWSGGAACGVTNMNDGSYYWGSWDYRSSWIIDGNFACSDSLVSAFAESSQDYEQPDECLGVCPDMNPAHIIRECLTEPWGLGYAGADIDNESFVDASDQLYTEEMGMSILWDREIPLEDFISEILRHIDAVLYVSRETGKFVLKLIRDDYTVGSLITLDETNSRMATNARRPALGELTTSVTVQFTDSEQDEEDGSVTVHNEALIQLQGSVSNAKVDYPGFMLKDLAARVALRDLKALSTPLLSCDVEAGRIAASLNIGDVFILDYPEQGISNLAMRIESMSVGDGKDNTVKISCIEDAFSTPDFAAVGDVGLGWVDPVGGTPLESDPRLMIESPYYEFVQRVGDLQAETILADDPDAGFIHANGGRQGNELNADLLVDSGGGYVDSGVLDFAPYAYLSLDAWYSDAKLYYFNDRDLDTVSFPALAQINDEIVRVDSLGLDSNGSFMTVGRGVLDTAPAEHTVESPDVQIVFFSPETDRQQYTASDSVNVKLLTALGSQRLADAPADTITFDSRAIRPYPPGNLEIDLESYPKTKIWDGMHSLSWAHRDRLQQTSGTIFDYTHGNIGPEAGTTYKVTVDAILAGGGISADFIDVDVGSATDWEQDSNTDSNVGPPPADADFIRFKVHSYRGGYESWQPAMVVIPTDDGVDSIGSADGLWTPAEITTALWLDAADAGTITEGSGAVSQWDDKSGNDRHVSQATGSQQPTYLSAELNGLNVVSFDGSNDRLDAAAAVVPDVFSAFLVAKKRNLALTTMAWASQKNSTSATTDRFILYSTRDTGSVEGAIQNGGTFASRTGTAISGYAQWGYTRNGTSGFIYVNGDSGTAVTTGSNANENSRLSIGAGNSAGDDYSDHDIAEVIFISGVVSEATRQLIEGYLAWKWGLDANLPSGHPYEFGAP